MVKRKFGVAVDEGIVREVDALVAECEGLKVGRSEVGEAIPTAVIQSEPSHVEQAQKIVIRKREGDSLADLKLCALSAHSFEIIILPQ